MSKGSFYDICYVGNFYSNNYGSILVHFAVAKLLEQEGVSVLMIDKPDTIKWPGHQETENIIPYAFARRHYNNISYQYSSIDALANTNDYCKGYVVGSDQMFNLGLEMDSLVYLQYARKDKLKISFGTSFGHDSYNAPYERLFKNKILLHKFDHIALREKPHNIVHNFLELDDAVEIIDPTLILSREIFANLADTAVHIKPKKPYLLTYLLDFNQAKEQAIHHIAKELNLDIINIPNANKREWNYGNSSLHFEKSYTPEEFLCLYKNSSFVVTDSYHGSCFSIIFRKNFVSMVNESRGLLRYKMFYNMGLKHRFYSDTSAIFSSSEWKNDVNYTSVATYIADRAAFAREWLSNSLSSLRKQEPSHIEQTACEDYPKKQGLRKALSKRVAYPVRDFFRILRRWIIGK